MKHKLIRLRKEAINEFNRLMQESFQFGYESVYGEDKERITWADEGIAQFLSGQKEELQDKLDAVIRKIESLS